MGLRFVYGRAGTGKSYWCMQGIKTSLLKDDNRAPLVLVVPEQYTLQAEKDLVGVIGSTGIVGAEVMSFRRMAYRVFNEVGGPTGKTIDASGKAMFLCSIIERIKGDLKVFSRAVKQPGFIGVISKTISEFKRYGIVPDDLERVCIKLAKDIPLRDKLQELSEIYRAFDEALATDYVDLDDYLTILSEKLDRCSFFEGAEIWIDGFSGFTPQEYKVIGELLEKARRVNVCLCIDHIDNRTGDETGVFAPTARTIHRLKAVAAERNISIEPPISMPDTPPHRFKNSKELAHLEREYFNFPYRVYEGKINNISIFAASNIYSEVEDVARYILKLCRDKGLRYKDIAVVARDPGAYNKLIGCIFDEYEIPYFLDSKKDISGNSLVQSIMSVFDIFIHNWSYQSVFRYLKAGFAGFSTEDVDILENYVLAWGIRGTAWTDTRDWSLPMEPSYDNRGMSDYEQKTLQRINVIKRSITRPLLEFYAKIKGNRTVKDICTALYEFLCGIKVPEGLQEKIRSLDDAGELNLANEYRQIWNIIIGVLDRMADTLGKDIVDIAGFRKLFDVGLSEHRLGLIPPALDQVLVADVTRSKSHDIKGLCVLGVNDGVFPAHSADEGILCDRDREKLCSLDIELAQDTRTRAMEEQFLIYSVLTTPAQYLRLSYAAADYRGGSLRPSVIISRIKGLFPAIVEYSDISGRSTHRRELDLVSAPLPTFNRLISRARARDTKPKPGDIWQQVHRWYMEDTQWRDIYKNMLKGLKYSTQTGDIGGQRATDLYGEPLYTSISRLERFTACPFAYFVQYGLRAKGRREFKLTAPDLGTFMHSVIDRFSIGLKDEGKSWRDLDKDFCDKRISAIIDNMLEENPELVLTGSARYRYVTERLKRILKRSVWTIALHIKRGGFEPLGYELAFDGKDGFPPIPLRLASGKRAYLTGRIDRVDRMETEDGTYLRVIDYKSGSRGFSLSDLYYGLQLQLITYLAALLESRHEGLKAPLLPAGFLYFRLEDPMIPDKSGMSEEEIEREILKKLKMDGLVLADTELIKEMDREVDGYSEIIPVRINKNGELSKLSSAATPAQFQALLSHTRGLLARAAEEILAGNISIAPYKQKDFTPCNYCEYSAICQFDTMFKDNRYRVLKRVKDEQIWNLIIKGEEKGETK